MIRSRLNMNKYVPFLFIWVMAGSVYPLPGQTTDKLFDLYYKGDMQNLRQELNKLNGIEDDGNEVEFYRAVFIKDAEQAVLVYKKLYKEGRGRVKVLSAERLYQYYYAKGYYETATKYQKYVAENEGLLIKTGPDHPGGDAPLDEPRKPVRDAVAPLHQIQVGAFSNEDNARELVRMLKTQSIDSRIVKRKIGEAELFCVWIPGKSTFEETLDYANTIKIKYDLNFRIIKE